MTFIDDTTNPFATEAMIHQWIDDTKENQKQFKDWIMEDPRRGIDREFKKEMEQERLNQFWGDGGSDVRQLVYKIPSVVYYANPDYWDNITEKPKKFKNEHPYFVV